MACANGLQQCPEILALTRQTSSITLTLLASGNRRRGHGECALGFDEGFAPVAVAQAVDSNTTAAAAAGVDKLVISQVDTGVADATAATGTEEKQIPRLEVVTRDQRCIHVDHFAGGAWQVHASFFAKQVTDKTAAIKTGFRGTAETVTGPDQGHAAFEDAVGQNGKLIRLVASEGGQFFFGCQLFLINSGRLRSNEFCLIFILLIVLLGHLLRVGGATKQQSDKCERHEGCEAI